MKDKIDLIFSDLKNEVITEKQAHQQVLDLCSLQPLTINNVSKMLDKISRETWVAVQGNENGWKEWWKNRNKLYLNTTDLH